MNENQDFADLSVNKSIDTISYDEETDSTFSTYKWKENFLPEWSNKMSLLETMVFSLFLHECSDESKAYGELITIFKEIILLFSHLEPTDEDYSLYYSQIIGIFQNISFSWSFVSDILLLFSNCVHNLISLYTWFSPCFGQILITLLFQFQFVSGKPFVFPSISAMDLVEKKLMSVKILLDCFITLLSNGKSLSTDSWYLLEEYVKEEIALTMKCSRTLFSFRFFLLTNLIESLLIYRGPSSRLTQSIVLLFNGCETLTNQLKQEQKVEESRKARKKSLIFDFRCFLLPIEDTKRIYFPYILESSGWCVSRKSQEDKRSNNPSYYGAGYWNDKVMNQYFEDSAVNKTESAFPSNHEAKVLYHQFIHYNNSCLSCNYDFVEFVFQWFSMIFSQKLYRKLLTGGDHPTSSSNVITNYRKRICYDVYELFMSWNHHFSNEKMKNILKQLQKIKKRSSPSLSSSPSTSLLSPPFTLFLLPPSLSQDGHTGFVSVKVEELVLSSQNDYFLVYLLLFAILCQNNNILLEEICNSFLQQIEQQLSITSVAVSSSVSSKQLYYDLIKHSNHLHFLTIVLSHAGTALINHPVFVVQSCERIMNMIIASFSSLQQMMMKEVDHLPVYSFPACFLSLLVHSFFYLIIHRMDIFRYSSETKKKGSNDADGDDGKTEENERNDALILNSIQKIKSFLSTNENSLSSCFSSCQWLYFQLFLFPLLHIGSVTDIYSKLFLSSSSNKQHLVFEETISQELSSFYAGSTISSPVESLQLFRFSSFCHSSFLSCLLFLSSSPSLQKTQFFSEWNHNVYADITEKKLPNIHTFCYHSLLSFLNYCKHLLIIPTKGIISSSFLSSMKRLKTKGVKSETDRIDDKNMETDDDQLFYFDALSDEVLYVIFSFLNYKRILKNISLLNKHCHSLLFDRKSSNIFWKEIYFRGFSKHCFLEDYRRKEAVLLSFSSTSQNQEKEEKKLPEIRFKSIVVKQIMEKLAKGENSSKPLKNGELPDCKQCRKLSLMGIAPVLARRENKLNGKKKSTTKKSSSGSVCQVRNSNHCWFPLYKVCIFLIRLSLSLQCSSFVLLECSNLYG
jgi:hypothetical protein